MSETRKHARALLAAIPKRAGTDVAGQSESGGILVSVHPGAVRFMDAHPDAHIGLMRLADEAPELLATLCDEADAAEDLYRSIKVRLGQTPGDGQLPHAAIDALERRAVEAEAAARLYAERRMNADMRADEAEANAASMREALAAVLNEHNPVRFTVCQDGECEHLALAEIAMANHAGRAILDRLERAEAERDALRAERDAARQAIADAIADAAVVVAELRAALSKAGECIDEWHDEGFIVIDPDDEPVLSIRAALASGSGAVIVEGEE